MINLIKILKKNKILETSFKPSSNASSSPNTPNLSTFLQSREKEFLKSGQTEFSPESLKEKFKSNFNEKKELYLKETSNEILNSTPGAPPINFNTMHYLNGNTISANGNKISI